MIPKQIAFFWAGGPLSWIRYMTVKSFCHYNPDWEVFIYTTEACETEEVWKTHERRDFDSYEGKDYWLDLLLLPVTLRTWNPDELKVTEMSPVHQSDIFSYWFLLNEGGFYSDFDILYTHPVSSDFLTSANLLVCPTGDSFTIGFLGAVVGDKFYADLLELALQRTNNSKYQSAGVDSVYELLCHSKKVHRRYIIKQIEELYGNVIVLPQGVIYPWDHNNVYSIFVEENNVPIMNVGIHWYGGTDLAQQCNKMLNEETIAIYKNTFTKYAKRIP